MTIPKVRVVDDADHDAITIHLFRAADGKVCGWYVGPVAIVDDGVFMPYLPRSEEARASIAVIRAVIAAEQGDVGLCLVDPDDLWDPAWSAA